MLLHPLQTEWDADVLAADPLGFPGYRPPAEESVLTGRTRGPRGYRLARRAIALAGQLGLPVLTLVDTPGSEPGPEAEAGGIASEIAATLAAMAHLPVPSVSVCVGEGGSGGALASPSPTAS
ncbi:MAG: hypothetical protein M3P34_01345 [Actinomycetota bacterium]|nr:hypothetical protein [Actinomycetota bacterium]